MITSDYPLHRPELHDLLKRGDNSLRQTMDPPRQYRKGRLLVRSGEASDTVYRLEAGWAVRYRELPNGSRQIILVFLPGELMGVKSMLLERQPDTIECLTDVTVRTIEQRRLFKLITDDPGVCARVMFQLAENERQVHNWLAALGRGKADQRIATLLLDLHGRLYRAGLANGEAFKIPMTQEQIADHLGLTLVHVNRVLRRLSKAGIVTVKHGVVQVEEMAQLSQLAAPLQDIFERSAPEFGGQIAAV
jgi:CRP/FNR family transcriptional regulator, anaerobic regulatory protein